MKLLLIALLLTPIFAFAGQGCRPGALALLKSSVKHPTIDFKIIPVVDRLARLGILTSVRLSKTRSQFPFNSSTIKVQMEHKGKVIDVFITDSPTQTFLSILGQHYVSRKDESLFDPNSIAKPVKAISYREMLAPSGVLKFSHFGITKLWERHPRKILSTAYLSPTFLSPTRKQFAIISRWGKVVMFDAFTGDILWKKKIKKLSDYSASFSVNGETFTISSENGQVYNFKTESGISESNKAKERVEGLLAGETLSPDGRYIAVKNKEEKTIVLLNRQTGQYIRTIASKDRAQYGSVSFSPDGTKLLLSFWNGYNQVSIINIQSGKEVHIAVDELREYSGKFISESNFLGHDIYDQVFRAHITPVYKVQGQF